MNLLVNILKKIHVIYAIHDGSRFDFHLVEINIDKNGVKMNKCFRDIPVTDITGNKFNAPLILIVSGKGVISKNYNENSEELKQITNQPNDFLFACEKMENGLLKVTFLRRKLYDALCKELNVGELPLVEVRIDTNNNLDEEARKAAEEFWTSRFSIKEAFTPSMRSSNLLSLIARKISLPVLSVLLAVLLANFFIRQNIAGRLKEQQYLLAQAKKNTVQTEKSLGEKQQILDQLANESNYPYAWIADQIASVVSDEIILTELNIQPLVDRVQENKPVKVERNKVVIKGKSTNSTSVAAFVDSIHGIGIFGTVELDILNKDKNDNYQFTLNISLWNN